MQRRLRPPRTWLLSEPAALCPPPPLGGVLLPDALTRRCVTGNRACAPAGTPGGDLATPPDTSAACAALRSSGLLRGGASLLGAGCCRGEQASCAAPGSTPRCPGG